MDVKEIQRKLIDTYRIKNSNLLKQKQFLIQGYKNSKEKTKSSLKSSSKSSSKINSPTYDNAIETDSRKLDTPLPKGVDYTKLKIQRNPKILREYYNTTPTRYDNLNEISKKYIKETFFLPVENPELNVNLNDTLFKNNSYYKQIKDNYIQMIIKLTNLFPKYRHILELFNEVFDIYDNTYMNINNIMNFYIKINTIINNRDFVNLFKIFEKNKKIYINYYRKIFINTNILIVIILNYVLKNTLINPINEIKNDTRHLILILFYITKQMNMDDSYYNYRNRIFNRDEININYYIFTIFDIRFLTSFYRYMLRDIDIDYDLIINSRLDIYKFIIDNALRSLENIGYLRTPPRTSLKSSLRSIPRSGGQKCIKK